MKKFIRYNDFLILYTLFVILWGAFVRISGSGDGCGEHWPLCQGQFLPDSPGLSTLIEKSHRLSTALYGLFILLLTIWAARLKLKNYSILTYSLSALFFTVVEALIGAKIVLAGLVGEDTSSARAIVVGFHLMNTFFLMGSLWLVRMNAQRPVGPKVSVARIFKSKYSWEVLIFLLLSSLGGIAALATTLFPSESLLSGLSRDLSKESPWFVQIRILHPIMTSLFCFFLCQKILSKWLDSSYEEKLLLKIVVISFFIGGLTLLSLSPLFLKLLHLFMAHLLWLALFQTALRKAEPQLPELN